LSQPSLERERQRRLLQGAMQAHERRGKPRVDQRCGEAELLSLVPMQQDESRFCVERGGAMTDKAWNQVCALARQPHIAGIKPMHFE
jgi:hypothetical protein